MKSSRVQCSIWRNPAEEQEERKAALPPGVSKAFFVSSGSWYQTLRNLISVQDLGRDRWLQLILFDASQSFHSVYA